MDNAVTQFIGGLLGLAIFLSAGGVLTFYPRRFLGLVDRLADRLPLLFPGYRNRLVWAYNHSDFNIAIMRLTGVVCLGGAGLAARSLIHFLVSR